MPRTLAVVLVRALAAAACLSAAVAGASPISAAEPTGGPAPVAAPRVVLIVGPAGEATDRYRAEAARAARVAREYTPDVAEIFAPDATWPAVRDALQGADVVVYLGHGNGWPSRYRDHPYPATQNGLGLNAEGGAPDAQHRYYGEAAIEREIRLADGAVVLLHHLCYASGLSEPGLPEGSIDEARQRVDNFAAGFIRAGASAVVAEAYARPDAMLRAILGGEDSIEDAWRSAPSANGHVFGFESVRSSGYVAWMDPERADAGFSRSLVIRAGIPGVEAEPPDARVEAEPPDVEPPGNVEPPVPADFGASIVAATALDLLPSERRAIPIWISNVGTSAWGRAAFTDPMSPDGSVPEAGARLVARWVPLVVAADDDAIPTAEIPDPEPPMLPAGFPPGGVEPAVLHLLAPTSPGDYLLVLGVVDPVRGSLIAAGAKPAIIRVRVADQSPASAPTDDRGPQADRAAKASARSFAR